MMILVQEEGKSQSAAPSRGEILALAITVRNPTSHERLNAMAQRKGESHKDIIQEYGIPFPRISFVPYLSASRLCVKSFTAILCYNLDNNDVLHEDSMFWGWFSFGDGDMRRGGGCIFLPFLFICGSFFLFDNLNVGWLLGLVIVAVLWMTLSSFLRPGGQPQMEMEKPKRDFDTHDFEDEKPKRDSEYLQRYNGEILEVVDPNEEEEDRPRTGF